MLFLFAVHLNYSTLENIRHRNIVQVILVQKSPEPYISESRVLILMSAFSASGSAVIPYHTSEWILSTRNAKNGILYTPIALLVNRHTLARNTGTPFYCREAPAG